MPLFRSLLSQHNVPLVYLAKPTFFFHHWLVFEGPITAGRVIGKGTAWVQLPRAREGLPAPSRSKHTRNPAERCS